MFLFRFHRVPAAKKGRNGKKEKKEAASSPSGERSGPIC